MNQLIYLPVTHHKSSHILTNGLQNPCLLLIIKRIWTGLNIVSLVYFQPIQLRVMILMIFIIVDHRLSKQLEETAIKQEAHPSVKNMP